MLLLLAVGENKAWLTVGDGISGSFPSSKIDSYFKQYFWDDFDAGNYEQATSNMLEALFTWYAGYYNVNQDNGNYTTYDGGYNNGYNDGYYNDGYYYNPWSAAVVWIVIVAIIIFIFVIAALADRRRYRMYYTHMGMPIPTYYPWFIGSVRTVPGGTARRTRLARRSARTWRTWRTSTARRRRLWRVRGGSRGGGGFGGFGGGSSRGGGGSAGSAAAAAEWATAAAASAAAAADAGNDPAIS
jgi:uncharacterized membrane protein YgcG